MNVTNAVFPPPEQAAAFFSAPEFDASSAASASDI
jgi:hypothetical protein